MDVAVPSHVGGSRGLAAKTSWGAETPTQEARSGLQLPARKHHRKQANHARKGALIAPVGRAPCCEASSQAGKLSPKCIIIAPVGRSSRGALGSKPLLLDDICKSSAIWRRAFQKIFPLAVESSFANQAVSGVSVTEAGVARRVHIRQRARRRWRAC